MRRKNLAIVLIGCSLIFGGTACIEMGRRESYKISSERNDTAANPGAPLEIKERAPAAHAK